MQSLGPHPRISGSGAASLGEAPLSRPPPLSQALSLPCPFGMGEVWAAALLAPHPPTRPAVCWEGLPGAACFLPGPRCANGWLHRAHPLQACRSRRLASAPAGPCELLSWSRLRWAGFQVPSAGRQPRGQGPGEDPVQTFPWRPWWVQTCPSLLQAGTSWYLFLWSRDPGLRLTADGLLVWDPHWVQDFCRACDL